VTTPRPDDWLTIVQIRDRDSLVLVSRVLESQRTVLESQLTQINMLDQVVQERIKSLG
jgi:hypothetical protein